MNTERQNRGGTRTQTQRKKKGRRTETDRKDDGHSQAERREDEQRDIKEDLQTVTDKQRTQRNRETEG